MERNIQDAIDENYRVIRHIFLTVFLSAVVLAIVFSMGYLIIYQNNGFILLSIFSIPVLMIPAFCVVAVYRRIRTKTYGFHKWHTLVIRTAILYFTFTLTSIVLICLFRDSDKSLSEFFTDMFSPKYIVDLIFGLVFALVAVIIIPIVAGNFSGIESSGDVQPMEEQDKNSFGGGT